MPIDPVTGAVISTASGSLSLLNTLIKMAQEYKANSKKHPPAMAEMIATLPGTAMTLTGEFIGEIQKLRKECDRAGIDLNLTLDDLQEESWFFQLKRRRVLKEFQSRVEGIADQIALFFDDLVAVANCCDALSEIAGSFKESRMRKLELRKQTSIDLPLKEILDNLQNHAETLRAEIGDL